MDRGGLPPVNHLLQYTLRCLCADTQWLYAVFWRIIPRNYPPPKWDAEGSLLDRTKGNKRNWILVWEDGFCDFCGYSKSNGKQRSACSNDAERVDEEEANLQPELFFKMSHEIYNYGEGLMGKVAADNSHKWIYRDPPEQDVAFLSPWQGSLDPYPRTWEAQFKAGIQTIAIVAVGEGLLQLGSLKKIMEDLNFVILLQRKFNYLQSIPGVFAPHPIPELAFRDTTHPTEDIYMKEKTLAAINGGCNHISVISQLLEGAKSSDLANFSLGCKGSPPTLFAGSECGGSNKPKNMFSSDASISQDGSAAAVVMSSMSSLQALLSKLPSVTAAIPAIPLQCTNSSSSPMPALPSCGGMMNPSCTKATSCCTLVEEKATCSGDSSQAASWFKAAQCTAKTEMQCPSYHHPHDQSTEKRKHSGCILDALDNISSEFSEEFDGNPRNTYNSLLRGMMRRE